MKGHIFALTIIIVAMGLIQAARFIYNHIKLEDEVLDLRKRLGR